MILTGLALSGVPAIASAQSKVAFDIEAGPAVHALNRYARQARVQVGFSMDAVDHVRTNAVKGSFEIEEALNLLLAGTGLVAEYGEKGIVIHRGGGFSEYTMQAGAPGAVALRFSQAAGERDMPGGDKNASRGAEDTERSWAGKLEEIIVTGTQIRGAPPVGASVIVLDRDYIEMSGLATTQEILQTLPQNVGLGANEATNTVGIAPGTFNFGEASSINLRGLGTASTLLLINGRRSASGGGRGDFVDLNSIPASAIDRVEVLPDGASAIYGSDAIGGVVNVILEDDYEGAATSFRYAPDVNDIEEMQFSQTLGTSWGSGHLLAIYDFYDRSALMAADRSYTRDSDLTRLGGTNHSRPASNPGNINRYTLSDGTPLTVQFAIPAGQDGTALTPADLLPGAENLQNIREGSTVLPEQRRHSVFATLRQDVSDAFRVFVESRVSTRDVESRPQQAVTNNLVVPGTNPFFVDPFGASRDLRINYSFSDDYGAQRVRATVDTYSVTAGLTLELGSDWELEGYVAHSREDTESTNDNFPNSALLQLALADPDPATAFNPFGDGSHTNPETLDAIAGFRHFDIRSRLSVLNIRANGALFSLPGGTVKLAVGSELRTENLRSEELSFATTLEPVSSPANFDLERDVTAVFSEIHFPFVSERNAVAGVRQLAVSVAARYERYSDFGDSLNPKVGMAWSPFAGLSFRSTFGTSFRAPLLVELDDAQRAYQVLTVPDPASPTGLTSALYLFGNNPELEAQEGTTWTVGFDVEPEALSGFRVGATWFETEVDKLISLPADLTTLPFLQPEFYGRIVERNPAEARLAALLGDPRCFCGSASVDDVDAIVDFRRQNLAKASLAGLDVTVAYNVDVGPGSLGFSLSGSHLFEFEEQLQQAPVQDSLDTIAKPNSLQVRGTLWWRTGAFQASVTADHIGDYTDDRSDPERHVSSWTTWDLRLAYDFDSRDSALLSHTSVALAIRNLFDRDPPFVDLSNGVGFDAINANAMQRLVAVQVQKAW